jgi:hypothetical protein
VWAHCCFCYNTIEVAPRTCRATDMIGETRHRITCGPLPAGVVKSVNTGDLKSPARKGLRVQFPPPA